MFVNGSKRNEQFPQKTFHRCFLPSFRSFELAASEQRIFRNRPIRIKNCLGRPCLLMDRDEMRNFIENLPQMLPTKFGFILQSGFRGEDFQKSTNQKQELPVAAIFVNGSRRNEQSLQRTSHRCILPSFGSFGKAISEEKIFQKGTGYEYDGNVFVA